MNRFFIYKITNLINGSIYIGKTNTPHIRWRDHKNIAKVGKTHRFFSKIHSVIKKYGNDNFTFEILEEFDDENEAYLYETWWIEYFGSYIRNNRGYNLNYGGRGCKEQSPETRQKISIAHKGKRFSPKTEFKKGHTPHNLGIPHSEKTRQKISKANIGLTHSKETRQKMSYAQRGENNFRSKTTEKIVLEIRQKYATGNYKKCDLAKEYKLSRDIIYGIISRKTWKHI